MGKQTTVVCTDGGTDGQMKQLIEMKRTHLDTFLCLIIWVRNFLLTANVVQNNFFRHTDNFACIPVSEDILPDCNDIRKDFFFFNEKKKIKDT